MSQVIPKFSHSIRCCRHGAQVLSSWLPLLALTLLIFFFPALPFADTPNHLARSFLLLHESEAIGRGNFAVSLHFAPYILGDICLGLLTLLFEPSFAARLWLAFLLVGFCGAFLLYIRQLDNPDWLRNRGLLALTLSYFGANYFFLSGYHGYIFSILLAFLTLTAWEKSRRAQARSVIWLLCYAALLSLTYLAHLAGFVFLGLVLTVDCLLYFWRREVNKLTIAKTITPLLGLSLYHCLNNMLCSGADEQWLLRSPWSKLLNFAGMIYRFELRYELWLFLILFALFLCLTYHCSRARHLPAPAVKLFLNCGTCMLAYVLLPRDIPPALDVDSRALPFIFLFLFSALIISQSRVSRLCFTLSLILAWGNVLVVATHWQQENAFLENFLQAVSSIPPGKALLPVYTRLPTGRLDYGTHHAEFYVFERGGLVPYIFADDTSPRQFPYFRYRKTPYAPHIFWYLREKDGEVDWSRIAMTYDYLIVTKPFDFSRLRAASLREYFANDAVVVLSVR